MMAAMAAAGGKWNNIRPGRGIIALALMEGKRPTGHSYLVRHHCMCVNMRSKQCGTACCAKDEKAADIEFTYRIRQNQCSAYAILSAQLNRIVRLIFPPRQGSATTIASERCMRVSSLAMSIVVICMCTLLALPPTTKSMHIGHSHVSTARQPSSDSCT
jgi:hypothetical protein